MGPAEVGEAHPGSRLKGPSMAIEMRCPHCDEAHEFPERRRGEQTHCSVCEHGFVIDDRQREGRRSRGGFTAGRDAAESVAKPWKRRRSDEDDEDDEERRPRRGSRKVRAELPWWEEHLAVLLV